MLLVTLELCSHPRLLDGNTALDLLKPYCPSQACATKVWDKIAARVQDHSMIEEY